MKDEENGPELDSSEEDGLNPDRDEGPGESESSPARSEFRQGQKTSGPDDAQFQVMDQVFEEFPVEPIPVVMGADGMPEIVTGDPSDAQAVPFTYETQLCIADDREYVELFKQEVELRGWNFSGARGKFSEKGEELDRRSFSPDEVFVRWGYQVVQDGDVLVPVRPRREVCKHYKRQVFSNDSQPDPNMPGHQIVFRLCTARRSNGGAFMSVSNEGIYACDFRDPPDLPTTARQDAKDKKKLVDRPDKVHLPLFGMPGDEVHVEADDQIENQT